MLCPNPTATRGEIIGYHGITRRDHRAQASGRTGAPAGVSRPLTRLANRRLMLNHLEQAMSASKRSQRHGALLFPDLDNFKPLSDTHGHGWGDLLLIRSGRAPESLRARSRHRGPLWRRRVRCVAVAN